MLRKTRFWRGVPRPLKGGRWMVLLLAAAAWSLWVANTADPDPSLPRYGQPLRGPMLLTGTFGELRNNHFHGGLDLRGAVGTPVYSIGVGYVSRIITDPSGYGQAVYINHPEGYTSVYGHLERFSDTLLAYVRYHQYKSEEFQQDLRPAPGEFRVAAGTQIGEVGNRGASGGPHLHFEIRHTQTDNPINPLAFGYEVADNRKPSVSQLRLYEIDGRGNVLRAHTHQLVKNGIGTLAPAGDTLIVEGPEVGLAVKAFDQLDGLYNWNGIYEGQLLADTMLAYQFRFDRYSFDETRYLNAHADYREQCGAGGWYHRLFRLPGNNLSIYRPAINDGRVRLEPGQSRRVQLRLSDYAGNASVVDVVLRRNGSATPRVQAPVYNYLLPYHEASIINDDDFLAYFPEGSLYEDCYLQYARLREGSDDVYSDVYQLHEPLTPLHHDARIGIRPRNLPDHLRDKAFIAYCHAGSRPVNYGGEWYRDGMLYTETRSFGSFCIMIDTVPPGIRPVSYRADMRRNNVLSFRIWDNFRTSGKADLLRTRATVDGQWILMEYDLKSGLIFHRFDGRLGHGQHQLRLEVTDDRGNTSVWEGTFLK